MKNVFSSAYVVECDQFRVKLSLAGIESVMRNEFGNPIGLVLIGGVCTFTWPEVLVDEADYETAAALAKAFIAASQSARSEGMTPVAMETEEWRCPTCGETVDGPMDSCWNCEEARPGK